MTSAIDLRGLDRHPDAELTSLIPALSCRSCRPNAPFAELVNSRERASLTRCGKNIVVACWATNDPTPAHLGKHIRHTVFKSWIAVFGRRVFRLTFGDLILEGGRTW